MCEYRRIIFLDISRLPVPTQTAALCYKPAVYSLQIYNTLIHWHKTNQT